MPLSVQSLKQKYQHLVAPGNDLEFERLLLEADDRLLTSGKWHWTRQALTITPVDGIIELPPGYQSIVACRLGTVPTGVVWQETEYYEGGPGEMPIDGTRGSRLIDQGWSDVLDDNSDSDESNDVTTRIRTYKVTDSSITSISVLCKFSPLSELESDFTLTLCPVSHALKNMMLAIVYEEAADLQKYEAFRQMAILQCDEQERAYRGLATEVFKPSLYEPVRYRSRRNFP